MHWGARTTRGMWPAGRVLILRPRPARSVDVRRLTITRGADGRGGGRGGRPTAGRERADGCHVDGTRRTFARTGRARRVIECRDSKRRAAPRSYPGKVTIGAWILTVSIRFQKHSITPIIHLALLRAIPVTHFSTLRSPRLALRSPARSRAHLRSCSSLTRLRLFSARAG